MGVLYGRDRSLYIMEPADVRDKGEKGTERRLSRCRKLLDTGGMQCLLGEYNS